MKYFLSVLIFSFGLLQSLAQNIIFQNHINTSEPIFCLAYCEQTKQIYIGGAQRELNVYNLNNKDFKLVGAFNGRINQVVVNKKGDRLAICTSKGEVMIWEIPDLRPIINYDLSPQLKEKSLTRIYLQQIISLTFGPNDKYLYFGGNSGIIFKAEVSANGQVTPWANLKKGESIPKITDLRLSPEKDKILACAGKIIEIPLANPEGRKVLFDLDIKDFSTIATPSEEENHKLVAWSYFSKQIFFWNDYRLDQNYNTRNLSAKPFASRMKFLDKDIVLSGTQDSGLVVFDLKKDSILQYLKDHTDKVLAIEVSDDKKYIFSGGYDRKLNIYQITYPDYDSQKPKVPKTSLFETIQNIQHLWFKPESTIYSNPISAHKDLDKLYKSYVQDTSTYIFLKGYAVISSSRDEKYKNEKEKSAKIENLRKLSELRAKKVRRDLIIRGVSPNRIYAEGLAPRRISQEDIENNRGTMGIDIEIISKDAYEKLKKNGKLRTNPNE